MLWKEAGGNRPGQQCHGWNPEREPAGAAMSRRNPGDPEKPQCFEGDPARGPYGIEIFPRNAALFAGLGFSLRRCRLGEAPVGFRPRPCGPGRFPVGSSGISLFLRFPGRGTFEAFLLLRFPWVPPGHRCPGRFPFRVPSNGIAALGWFPPASFRNIAAPSGPGFRSPIGTLLFR
jgi:hypothetical protein